MNKRYKILIVLCMVFNSVFILAKDISTIRIGSTVADKAPRPPYKWQKSCSADSDVTGSYPQLVEMIFESVGKTVEWGAAPIPSESRAAQVETQLRKLVNGEYDFLVSPRVLENKNYPLVIMDKPLFTRRSSIISRVNNPVNSSDISVLKSYTAGVISTDSIPSPTLTLVKSLQLPVKSYSDESSAFIDLMAENIDYVINGYYTAKLWTNKHKVDNQLVFKDFSEPERSYYLIAAENSDHLSLMGGLSQTLVEYENSGLIRRLHNAYMKIWVSDPCF